MLHNQGIWCGMTGSFGQIGLIYQFTYWVVITGTPQSPFHHQLPTFGNSALTQMKNNILF